MQRPVKPPSSTSVVQFHPGARKYAEASGNGLTAVPPKDGCLVRLQAEAQSTPRGGVRVGQLTGAEGSPQNRRGRLRSPGPTPPGRLTLRTPRAVALPLSLPTLTLVFSRYLPQNGPSDKGRPMGYVTPASSVHFAGVLTSK
jgi:hypothetical protein